MNAGRILGWIGGVAAVLVGGCESSARVARIDRMRGSYEQWPIELRQAVLDGKVEVGMTEEMVTVALATPTEVVDRPSAPGAPEEKIWIYQPLRAPDLGRSPRDNSRANPPPNPVVDHNIVFRDGVVLRVDRTRVQ